MDRTLIPVLVAIGLSGVAAAEDPDERLVTAAHQYRHDCAFCHGAKGEGNDKQKVPAVAGLPDYYVLQQMQKFRRELRALDPDDPQQQSMHKDARAMTDEEFKALGQIIAAWKPRRDFGTFPGDPKRGEAIYVADCATCHGKSAEGDAAKESPPLHGFQPWYLVQQIERFKAGLRKGDPQKLESLTMHALACKMWTEVDIEDVAAYIATRLEGESDAEP